MENLNSLETSTEFPQGSYVPSEVLAQVELQEVQNPATEDQLSEILSDAQSLVGEIPTTRHSEQDRFDKVDVDEANLDDVTVRHIHGQDSDVTVIEPTLDDRSARIVIDNKSSQVFIDGEPVDQSEADKVSSVIRLTRNMNAQHTEHESGEVVKVDGAETSAAEEVQEQQSDLQPKLSPEQEEKIAQQKRQVLGVVGELLRTRNGDTAFKQLASQIGVEPMDLQEKMKNGDITITPETMKALDQLRRDGAQPKSDIWATDPRAGSMLGGAARESQQLLSNVIRSMF
jgi:hypothetical protein